MIAGSSPSAYVIRCVKRIASKVDGGEAIFCIDSMPIEVCRPIRSKRCKMGKNNYDKAPNYGYCASRVNIITDIITFSLWVEQCHIHSLT